MKPANDPVDAALESLRVHGASPCDSLPHGLEQKLMDADRRRSVKTSWLVKSLIAAAILTGSGVVGYAAVEGRWWESFTFDIGDDGLVTNEKGHMVGETIKKDDGTYSTFIQITENGGITTTSDEPLTGTSSIFIGTPDGKTGDIVLLREGAETPAPADEE